MEQYAQAFIDNDIDEHILPSLDADDLKELGIKSLGHRKRLLVAISAFADSEPVASHSSTAAVPASRAEREGPLNYVPKYLAQRIIESRYALEGERKQVTVLFADIKGSMALIAGTDPDFAAQLIDPAVEAMMAAVHRFDGTVNRVQGDGIMALFGAPVAQEDHALRACYAALRLRNTLATLSERSRRTTGVDVDVRVGLNSGEVIVRAIKNDLTVNYDAMGETAHLASRMEQLAPTGSIRIAHATYVLVRDFVNVEELGPLPVKGMDHPVPAYQLISANSARTRIQVAASAGFSRFVGRTHELSLLGEAFDSSAGKHGRIVGVVGEPGVGKSRLFYEFAQSAGMRKRLVLTAGSVSHGRASAYLPVADLLRQYFDIEPDDDPRRIHEKVLGRLLTLDESLRHTLAALLFILDAPIADPDWDSLDPSGRRIQIVDSLRALFLRQSAEQPMVLILEDLHWFDSESLGIIDSLIGTLAHAPILMLTNFRPEFSETWSNHAPYTRIRLEPLGTASMHDLLDHLLGNAPELAGLKHTLVTRTEGNPLFIEESVRGLIETGVLTGVRGDYRLEIHDSQIELPSSIQSVIAARMDRLEPDTKRLLQCASVIGKEFSFELLAAIADLDESAIESGLGTLKDAEFVYEVKLFPEKEYTFKHALTHQVTYGSLINHRRVALHTRALEVAESKWSAPTNEQLQMLARHASAGEMWEKASEYGNTAGVRLAEHNAIRPASIAFEIALEALSKLPHEEDRVRATIALNFRLRDMYFILGDFDRVPARLEEAARLCEEIGDQELLCWSTLQHSGYCWASGQLEAAAEAAVTAIEVSNAIGDDTLRALGQYRHGLALTALGRFQEACDQLVAALGWLDSEDGREYFQLGGLPFCFVCSFYSWSLAELGELEQAEHWGRRGYEQAVKASQRYTQCVAAFGLGRTLIFAGRDEDALLVLEQAYELAVSGEASATVPWLGGFLAQVYARTGAEDRARAGIEESRREQGPLHGASFFYRGLAYSIMKDQVAADAELLKARSICTEQKEDASLAWTNAVSNSLYSTDQKAGAHLDDPRKARLTGIRDLAEGKGWRQLEAYCEAQLSLF